MSEFQVEWVQLSGGETLPAYKMICPECKTLVLGTKVNTTSMPWRGHCPDGHSWRIDAEADA